jgi:predicted nucleotide-binding protein
MKHSSHSRLLGRAKNTEERPIVFIGSSTEGLQIAKQLQVGLSRVARCKLWTQGVFGLTQGTLESLIETAKSSDFAILVMTPDDLITKRAKKANIPRDNVIFELGLFMGALGRDRTFIVHSRDDSIDLPSDLAGITTATFQNDEDLGIALGEVCTLLEQAIDSRGKRLGEDEPSGVMSDLIGKWKGVWFVVEQGNKSPHANKDDIYFKRISGEKVFATGVHAKFGSYDLVGRINPAGVLTFYYKGDAQRHFSGGVVILRLKTNSRKEMSGFWYEFDANREVYGGETTWKKV